MHITLKTISQCSRVCLHGRIHNALLLREEICVPRMLSHPTTHPTTARCLRGHNCAEAVYLERCNEVRLCAENFFKEYNYRIQIYCTHNPPQVGNALTISAILAPTSVNPYQLLAIARSATSGRIWCAPRVKHMQAPRIQHHVTEAGPPRRRGVLKVVATLEHRPMMLNAKLICKFMKKALRIETRSSGWAARHG